MTTLVNDLKTLFSQAGTATDLIYDHECVGLLTLTEIRDILRHLCLEYNNRTAIAYPLSYTLSCREHGYVQNMKMRILVCNLDEADWLISALEEYPKAIDSSLTNSFSDETVNELFNFYVFTVRKMVVYMGLKKVNDSWTFSREIGPSLQLEPEICTCTGTGTCTCEFSPSSFSR